MCGAAVESGDALGLVHSEGSTEKGGIVEIVGIGIATLTVQELTHIIAAVKFATVFERGDGHLLDVLHRQVDVFPVVTIVGVTVVFHLVCLIIRPAGIVHRHDKSAVDGSAHHRLAEGLRRIGLGRSDCLAVLVLKNIGELLRRFADGHDEHLIDLAEHADLGLVDGGLLTILLGHIPQLQTIFAQFRGDERTGF